MFKLFYTPQNREPVPTLDEMQGKYEKIALKISGRFSRGNISAQAEKLQLYKPSEDDFLKTMGHFSK